MNIPKSVLKSEKPKDRECETCPRWKTMCKGIWDICGTLSLIEFCPIWNDTYNKENGLWYYQSKTQDDYLIESVDPLEAQIIKGTKEISEKIDVVCQYVKVSDVKYIINVRFNDYERIENILYIHLELRKIDILVHDDEYFYKLLTEKNFLPAFLKVYHYVKSKFKKLQMRGTSNNKIYFEAFDDNKIDEFLIAMIESYHKALGIIDFELLEKSSTVLNNIFGDDDA